MANPARFNRQDAINEAVKLFWEKGFHGTSTRDLQARLDMRPGSIYAAFQSKSGLFSEALDQYTAQLKRQLKASIAGQSSILAGLQSFFLKVLKDDVPTMPNEVCLLARSLTELDGSEPELFEQAKQQLASMEQLFVAQVGEAKRRGELPEDTQVTLLAKQLLIQLTGLRTYNRATHDSAFIESSVSHLFDYPPRETMQ